MAQALIDSIEQLRKHEPGGKRMKLDRYARDAQAWTNSARVAYTASAHLFTSENFMLVFPAATLGHHALEMFLKAALIVEG